MNSKNKNFWKTIVGLVSLAMMILRASAGEITTHDIPETGSDSGSGISSSNVYTHALDFGNNGSWGATYQINGVTFTHLNASGAFNISSLSGTDATTGKGFSLVPNAYTIQQYSGGTSTHADGQISNLLNDFVTMGNWADMVLTLSDLTAGENYSTRFYYRPWTVDGARTDTLTFNGDGTDLSTNFNEDSGSSAHYISYNFTASGTTEVITIGKEFHLYGVTNQVFSSTTTTTTTLESSPPDNSVLGDTVTFTATVKAGELNVPSGMGTVEFKSDIDGVLPEAGAIDLTNGVATYSTSALSATGHTITATYSGDSTYAGSSATVNRTVTTTPFATWAYQKIKLIKPDADASATGDADGDGSNNLSEYAFGGDPLSGSDNARVFSQFKERDISPNGKELILTVAVLADTPALEFAVDGNSLTATSTLGGITYRIEGSNNLVFPGGPEGQVSELIPAEATTAMVNVLPASGYVYRSFVLSAGGTPAKGFLRVVVGKP